MIYLPDTHTHTHFELVSQSWWLYVWYSKLHLFTKHGYYTCIHTGMPSSAAQGQSCGRVLCSDLYYTSHMHTDTLLRAALCLTYNMRILPFPLSGRCYTVQCTLHLWDEAFLQHSFVFCWYKILQGWQDTCWRLQWSSFPNHDQPEIVYLVFFTPDSVYTSMEPNDKFLVVEL